MRRFPSPNSHRHLALSPLAVAACSLCLSLGVQAQNTPDDASTLPSVGVTAAAKRQAKASIAGLGDGPAWQQPVQAQTFSEEMLKDAQVTRLADLTKLDASVSDGYNTVGYIDTLTVRGFVLDNAYNYRREGLPISAETRIGLENKAAVEVFKGTSGIQAGVSSPGGLVNFLVKRPEGRVRSATFSVDNTGDAMSAVDLGDRFGERRQWGVRVNAAIERLNRLAQIDPGFGDGKVGVANNLAQQKQTIGFLDQTRHCRQAGNPHVSADQRRIVRGEQASPHKTGDDRQSETA